MNNRFKKKQDCYLDTKTKLEWSLDNFGILSWKEAIRVCDSLGDGWRLPTIKELMTLINRDGSSPTTELPRMLASNYWSSTAHDYFTADARLVGFSNGHDYSNDKSLGYYVRAVRG